MFLTNLNAKIVACILLFRKSCHKPNLESTSRLQNGVVLSMHMPVILDSLFPCLGSAPIGGGKKGEFRDWTRPNHVSSPIQKWYRDNRALILPLSGNSREADQLVPMRGLVFVQSSSS